MQIGTTDGNAAWEKVVQMVKDNGWRYVNFNGRKSPTVGVGKGGKCGDGRGIMGAVSYTHLTLPTICSV